MVYSELMWEPTPDNRFWYKQSQIFQYGSHTARVFMWNPDKERQMDTLGDFAIEFYRKGDISVGGMGAPETIHGVNLFDLVAHLANAYPLDLRIESE